MGVVTIWQIQYTSALTHNISGTAKVDSICYFPGGHAMLIRHHASLQACVQTIIALQLQHVSKVCLSRIRSFFANNLTFFLSFPCCSPSCGGGVTCSCWAAPLHTPWCGAQRCLPLRLPSPPEPAPIILTLLFFLFLRSKAKHVR